MTTFDFLGHNFSIYGVCSVIGFITGILYLLLMYLHFRKKGSFPKNIEFENLIYIYVWGTIGAVIGAKVLFLLVESKTLIMYIRQNGIDTGVLYEVFSAGFVFYGGLIGALAGAYLSCRFFKYDVGFYSNLLIPVFPLMHAFGRVGCHLVGCCYGVRTKSLIHVIYTESAYAPNNTPLVPVQLIEAFFELICVVALTIMLIKGKRKLVMIYLIGYAVFRFCLEFFRGDEARGHIGFLSTSQIISIGMLLFVGIKYIIYTRKQS